MDGFAKRLIRSLQFQLSLAVALTLTLAASIAGYMSYSNVLDEAHELQDGMLMQAGALAAQAHRHSRAPAQQLEEIDDDVRFHIQQLGARRRKGDLALPDSLPEGFQDLTLKGEAYRVFVQKLGDGSLLAIAQNVEERDEIAQESAWHALMPMLVLVPVLWLLVWALVRHLFRPVAQLATEAGQRDGTDLQPLPTHRLPTEVLGFVTAINRLLDRVAKSVDAQRRFVADAAHELRSPMTALSLQAERLAATELSPEASERLQTLRKGIDRNRHLLEQLLGLARAQADRAPPTLQAVSLSRTGLQVLEDLMPLAEARRIDLGVEGTLDGEALALEHDLMIVVRNLVDNAIRYTPEGGQINLRCHQTDSGPVLEVEDSGPGIPVAERSRVLDAFYRVPGTESQGSGLGLSIVQVLLHRMGASLTLDDARHFSSGLLARVSLRPVLPPHQE